MLTQIFPDTSLEQTRCSFHWTSCSWLACLGLSVHGLIELPSSHKPISRQHTISLYISLSESLHNLRKDTQNTLYIEWLLARLMKRWSARFANTNLLGFVRANLARKSTRLKPGLSWTLTQGEAGNPSHDMQQSCQSSSHQHEMACSSACRLDVIHSKA